MQAIEIEGGALVLRERADPEPGPGEVRIENRATAVNRADLVQREGRSPPPPKRRIEGWIGLPALVLAARYAAVYGLPIWGWR